MVRLRQLELLPSAQPEAKGRGQLTALDYLPPAPGLDSVSLAERKLQLGGQSEVGWDRVVMGRWSQRRGRQ